MLSTKQLKEIKKLQKQCEEAENLQLKLNWEMLKQRNQDRVEDFFHYDEEELAAFLGLYGFGNKVELCGMVKPEQRRKGIFSVLLQRAVDAAKEQGYDQILLNAPANSETAKKFLKTIPCSYAFSEHQMKWEGNEPGIADESISLRAAKQEDLAFEIKLDIDCFGFDPNGAKDYNNRIKKEEDQQFYIIEYEGIPVGKIRVSAEAGEAWIYGFAITPSQQGKGIGRKTLNAIIWAEHAKGHSLFLEVEAKNDHALKLYESCGFQSFYTQDYYHLPI